MKTTSTMTMTMGDDYDQNALAMCLLPGMQVSLRALVQEMNQVRRALGMPGEVQVQINLAAGNQIKKRRGRPSKAMIEDAVGVEQTQPQPQPQRKGEMSEEGRARMAKANSKAMKALWGRKKAEQLAQTGADVPTVKVKSNRGHTKFKAATSEQLLSFARRRRGVLDMTKFKEANPKLHGRVVGLLTAYNKLTKTEEPGVYKLVNGVA